MENMRESVTAVKPNLLQAACAGDFLKAGISNQIYSIAERVKQRKGRNREMHTPEPEFKKRSSAARPPFH
jgi:hypothetical protein